MEKVVCIANDNDSATLTTCLVKYINRRELTLDVSLMLKKRLDAAFLHAVVYYRYNGIEYKKFPIDIWEDMCGWFKFRYDTRSMKKMESFFAEWILKKFSNYTNLNHTCPYEGEIATKVARFPIGSIEIPQLLPAGRYRLDIIVLEGDRKSIVFATKIFYSISDHRIERF